MTDAPFEWLADDGDATSLDDPWGEVDVPEVTLTEAQADFLASVADLPPVPRVRAENPPGLSYDPETGAGLLGDTEFIVFASRGGGYGSGTPRYGWDHAETWLPHGVSLMGLVPRFITAELTLADRLPVNLEFGRAAAVLCSPIQSNGVCVKDPTAPSPTITCDPFFSFLFGCPESFPCLCLTEQQFGSCSGDGRCTLPVPLTKLGAGCTKPGSALRGRSVRRDRSLRILHRLPSRDRSRLVLPRPWLQRLRPSVR